MSDDGDHEGNERVKFSIKNVEPDNDIGRRMANSKPPKSLKLEE